MALTNEQVKKMWGWLYMKANYKADIKAGRLPSRAERQDIFDAIQTYWDANRLAGSVPAKQGFRTAHGATLKPLLDTAAGFTLMDGEAKSYVLAWIKLLREEI